jgi:excisionase family DNA binding protein
MGEPILLSKRDSAAALGISLRMLEMLIAVQELKSVRVGRRRLVPRHELEKFARRDQSIPGLRLLRNSRPFCLTRGGKEDHRIDCKKRRFDYASAS